LGRAKAILGIVPSGKVMSSVLGGLAVNGKLIMIGAFDEMIEVPPNLMLDVDRLWAGLLEHQSIHKTRYLLVCFLVYGLYAYVLFSSIVIIYILRKLYGSQFLRLTASILCVSSF
jgi:hypothetical protein